MTWICRMFCRSELGNSGMWRKWKDSFATNRRIGLRFVRSMGGFGISIPWKNAPRRYRILSSLPKLRAFRATDTPYFVLDSDFLLRVRRKPSWNRVCPSIGGRKRIWSVEREKMPRRQRQMCGEMLDRGCGWTGDRPPETTIFLTAWPKRKC